MPLPPQDFDAAIRSGLYAIGLRPSYWSMALDMALQIFIPTMQFSLLLALVVATASVAASGTSWLIEVAVRRGWLSRGRR